MIRLLSVVTLVGLVLGVAGLAVPRVAGGDDDGQREQLLARAADFAATYNTYEMPDLESWQGRMESLLTEEFNDDFTQQSATYFEQLGDAELISSDPEVESIGISSMDSDSATLLIAVNASISSSEADAPEVGYFRMLVDFTRPGDTWLVSDFAFVNTVEAQRQPGAADPSATPAPPAGEPETDQGDEGQ